jgi:hypothetical protein
LSPNIDPLPSSLEDHGKVKRAAEAHPLERWERHSEIYDDDAWNRLWSSEVHDRWGEIMNLLMHFGADGKVDSTVVNEVFHLETNAGIS